MVDPPTKACIGCGWCCRKARCIFGISAAEKKGENGKGPCTLLRWNGERWICGFYEDAPESMKAQIATELSFGAGCCASLNDYARTGHVPTPDEIDDEPKKSG